MRYMLLLYADEAGGRNVPPQKMRDYMGQMYAYKEALAKANAFVLTERLGPTSEASTLRVRDGQTAVQDGPYADTREQLGGYFIIDVTDADEARRWAARCPAATWGTIEIRPIFDAPKD